MARSKFKIMERMAESGSSLSGAGTYYSDQGVWEVGAASSESISGVAYSWGNVDNYLKITVQWGWADDGEWPYEHATPSSSSMNWEDDNTLVYYFYCGAATTDKTIINFNIPVIKYMFRKLKVELVGTTAACDIRLNSLQEV